MLNKLVYNKYIEKSQLQPGIRYTPPKPLYTFSNFNDLWRVWASKQFNKGRILEVEKNYDGERHILQCENDKVLIYSKDSSINKVKQFPEIEKELKKIGSVILDVVLRKGRIPGTIRVFAFDCIYYKGQDLTDMPLYKRRKILKRARKGTSFKIPKPLKCNSGKELRLHIDNLSSKYEVFSKGIIIKVWNSSHRFELNTKWAIINKEFQEYYVTSTPYYKYNRTEKRVVRRGNRWCVVHTHPPTPGSETDKPVGTPIKCFIGPNAKEQAEEMHRAILAQQKRIKRVRHKLKTKTKSKTKT